jgi:hypothetical protein
MPPGPTGPPPSMEQASPPAAEAGLMEQSSLMTVLPAAVAVAQMDVGASMGLFSNGIPHSSPFGIHESVVVGLGGGGCGGGSCGVVPVSGADVGPVSQPKLIARVAPGDGGLL